MRWVVHSSITSRSSGRCAGHRLGPEREVGGVVLADGDGLATGADVDLLTPIDAALGEFTAETRVPVELGGFQVLDRELVGIREGEERARGRQ